jgi:hypothetical protein
MTLLSEKNVFRLIVLSLVLATLYRLYPLVLGPSVLREAFRTEDGYRMLTIARNMAIGLGMSVSDGTIASNGVQPMATFLFAIPYALTGGDKVLGVAGVQLISAVIAVIGIFTVRSFMRLVLAPQDDRPLWPWMLAAIWFASPILLMHTMNGLETGLYTVMLTVTVVLFGKVLLRPDARSFRLPLLLGVAGGVTFLARNDAVFLLFSIFAVWFYCEVVVMRRGLGATLRLIIPSGLLIIAISSPWMISNYINFGSIVPVSGTAQALSGGFARNADILPAMLFEYAFPMLPIPASIQTMPVFQIGAIASVVTILTVFMIQTWRRGGTVRYVVLSYLIYAVAMSAYYGFYFGAGWFLSRYLSPLGPLLMVATFSVAYSVAVMLLASQSGKVMRGLGVLSLLLCFALLGRFLIPGVKEQGHFQVVDWVTENVTEETWVGAVQTGTVGYWHDRTINLDGKVNPAALNALLTEGHVLNYVLDSSITYLADWHGLANWVSDDMANVNGPFTQEFTLLVHEPGNNLAVLQRK